MLRAGIKHGSLWPGDNRCVSEALGSGFTHGDSGEIVLVMSFCAERRFAKAGERFVA